MKISMRLTMDGLIRTLRATAHALAEEVEMRNGRAMRERPQPVRAERERARDRRQTHDLSRD